MNNYIILYKLFLEGKITIRNGFIFWPNAPSIQLMTCFPHEDLLLKYATNKNE